MRPSIRQFVASVAQTFDLRSPIYEFGSYQVEGQEHIGNLRTLFPASSAYLGCDMRAGPGVDRIEDVSALTFGDNSLPSIICLETLEHVFEVRRAIDEMLRVLAPGGMILFSTPFHFHIHDYPSDYWRITPACLERLLEPLPAKMVGYQGTETTPHTVYGLGMKRPVIADFRARATAFITAYERQLKLIADSVPRKQRWRSALRSAFLTKGERRQRQQYYDCHFQIHESKPAERSDSMAA